MNLIDELNAWLAAPAMQPNLRSDPDVQRPLPKLSMHRHP